MIVSPSEVTESLKGALKKLNEINSYIEISGIELTDFQLDVSSLTSTLQCKFFYFKIHPLFFNFHIIIFFLKKR